MRRNRAGDAPACLGSIFMVVGGIFLMFSEPQTIAAGGMIMAICGLILFVSLGGFEAFVE